MNVAARWDHHDHSGRPAWIGLMVLGFIFWWPVGLATLAFLIWSGKMHSGCHAYWNEGGAERWRERMVERRARWEAKWARHHGPAEPRGSGNRAFDEYRAETLRRLEDEEKEFKDFLDRLRFAKDKQEFDEFLNQRRAPIVSPDSPSGDRG
jgi:hypothetical protein